VQIIPVIDLMNGVVVHARKGRRDGYRPVDTPLCRDAAPHAVIAALMDLHPFDTVYVADLDALMGKGGHRKLLDVWQADYPRLKFWVDQGLSESGAMRGRANCLPVIGSESLSEESLSCLKGRRDEFILSLDFMGERLLGAKSLMENSCLWPEKIIVMSLSLVGGERGPDFRRLARFRAEWPERSFIAAGGVRDEDDLRRLEDLGLSGALVASALHSGALGSSVLWKYG